MSKDYTKSFEYAKENWIKVGQHIKPADGSNHKGIIIEVDYKNDIVKYVDLNTGIIYEKSVFGFYTRYCTIGDK